MTARMAYLARAPVAVVFLERAVLVSAQERYDPHPLVVGRVRQSVELRAPRCELLAARSFVVVGAGRCSATACRSRSRPMALLYLCAVQLLGSPSLRVKLL